MIRSEIEDTELRAWAVRRLKKRRDLAGQVLIYMLVNGFIVLVWAITDGSGFFWPIFPMALWGIGLVMSAWDTRHNDPFSDHEIESEIERIRAQELLKR